MDNLRKRRWGYLFNATVVFSFSIYILGWQHKWNVFAMYAFGYHSMWLVLFYWAYLWWGLFNLLRFINFNANYKEMDDIGKKEEDE